MTPAVWARLVLDRIDTVVDKEATAKRAAEIDAERAKLRVPGRMMYEPVYAYPDVVRYSWNGTPAMDATPEAAYTIANAIIAMEKELRRRRDFMCRLADVTAENDYEDDDQ